MDSDCPQEPKKPDADQKRRRWLPEKGPHGRRWHPDLCGSGGVKTRAPFLDELDRDSA